MDLYQEEDLEMFKLQMLQIYPHTEKRSEEEDEIKLWGCECTVNQDLNDGVIRILSLKGGFFFVFNREREEKK